MEARVSVKATCEAAFGLKATMAAISTIALEVFMFSSSITMIHIVLITVLVGLVLLRPWLGFNPDDISYTLPDDTLPRVAPGEVRVLPAAPFRGCPDFNRGIFLIVPGDEASPRRSGCQNGQMSPQVVDSAAGPRPARCPARSIGRADTMSHLFARIRSNPMPIQPISRMAASPVRLLIVERVPLESINGQV